MRLLKQLIFSKENLGFPLPGLPSFWPLSSGTQNHTQEDVQGSSIPSTKITTLFWLWGLQHDAKDDKQLFLVVLSASSFLIRKKRYSNVFMLQQTRPYYRVEGKFVSMRVWELSYWWIASLSWGWGGTLPPFHYWTCCINVQNSQEMQGLIPALVPMSWVTDLTQVTSLLRWEKMSGPGNLQGGCQRSRSMIWCLREINQILGSGMSAKRYRKQKIYPMPWMNFSFTRGD